MVAGISSLQQLNLRNNLIANLSSDAFDPVRSLTTLDLGQNQLVDLPNGIFTRLIRLFWLDVSDNKLATLRKTDFPPRVANILLQGLLLWLFVHVIDCSCFLLCFVHVSNFEKLHF